MRIGYNNAQARVKQAKTEDSVLESVRDRVRNYLAHKYDIGQKISTTCSQLIVKRMVSGKKERVLAIKIANETFDFYLLEQQRDDVEQIEEAIEDLENCKTELFFFSQWVDFNVGKPKAKRMSRPTDWNTSPIPNVEAA